MYSRDNSGNWRNDLKWLSCIVLVLAAAGAGLFFMLQGLTRPETGTLMTGRLLGLALQAEPELRVAADAGRGHVPGEPLQLLPGLEIFADPTEISEFDSGAAGNRIAGVLTGLVLERGQAALQEVVTDQELRARLDEAIDGPVTQLVSAQLGAALLGAGLADGSRLADWRTQALNNPGAPVQPVVGVFVTADADLVEQLSAAQIGELVVDGLAAEFVQAGAPAARELLANNTLLALFDSAAAGPLASGLHGLFQTLMLGWSAELEARLENAQAAIRSAAAAPVESRQLVSGLVEARELEGLSSGEANALVMSRLAERVHGAGTGVLPTLLTDRSQLALVREAGPLLEQFSAETGTRRGRTAWLLAGLAVLAGLLVVVFSSGRGRLVNPGLALLVAGVPGLLAVRWLQERSRQLAEGSGQQEAAGLFGSLSENLLAVIRTVPAAVLDAALLPWLVVAGAGALLLLIAVVMAVVPAGGARRYRL